jgi:hypothetical protein
MYVSTINILWSVVYITGYKEKDKLLNWARKNVTPTCTLISSVTDWLQLAGATSDNAEQLDIRPAALRIFLVFGTHYILLV